ncbi:MAG: YpfJ protein, zinc metalloprotease superfamily [uncultured Solirubrobacteraceae bacterium]|uniref:YpfJ protein, zinc metalloprotease superfamily n=1 Tax=uncultured Solirubrobacteraceae bacterium TaxID=1162706 RepID=A0A6J4TQN5_9ACTN|nr:MAG: YpfJ protein, zinc metalloprotease superfamily [uncultured Solirubrobacteraceae bacterium]
MLAAVFFWPDPPDPLEVEAAFPASVVAPRAPVPAGSEDRDQRSRNIVDAVDTMWRRIFRDAGARYERPKVGFFSGSDEKICGAETDRDDLAGLYCPSDRKIWLSRRAQAELNDLDWQYVVAHEVGHHVQKLRDTVGDLEPYRVAHELQADCYAGVWAAAVGAPEPSTALYTVDDGTHGTPGQQQDWLRRGRSTRRPGACASRG